MLALPKTRQNKFNRLLDRSNNAFPQSVFVGKCLYSAR